MVGSAVVDRNVEWSYKEALSDASQVVNGSFSVEEVVEKKESDGSDVATA